MPRDRDVRFEVLTTDRELEQIRPSWVEWYARGDVSPFTSPAFFDAWHRAFSGEKARFVIAARVDRELAWLLPMWHHTGRRDDWFAMGSFRSDYTEAISASDDRGMHDAFWRWLERDAPCRSAKLDRIPTDTDFGRSVPATAFDRRRRLVRAALNTLVTRRVRYVSAEVQRQHPYADPAAISEGADRLDAKWMRRNIKMLQKTGAVTYSIVVDQTAIAALLPAFFAMHVAYFADTGRRSQFESEPDRSFFTSLATHPDLAGTVYFDVLATGDRPCALHLGFHHRDRIYYYKPAFDHTLGKTSPGKIMLAYLFERARQQRAERVDLLKGTEAYKADWANHSRETVTATLVTRRLDELARRAVGRHRNLRP